MMSLSQSPDALSIAHWEFKLEKERGMVKADGTGIFRSSILDIKPGLFRAVCRYS